MRFGLKPTGSGRDAELGAAGDISNHEKGHEAVVELLIANYADINAKNQEGCTPLYMTAFEGHRGAAEFLIAAGADVKIISNDSVTFSRDD